MSRNRGIFNLSGNYEPLIAAPLDSRQVVDTLQDLTNPEIWSSSGTYLFKGLLTAVVNDSKFLGKNC